MTGSCLFQFAISSFTLSVDAMTRYQDSQHPDSVDHHHKTRIVRSWKKTRPPSYSSLSVRIELRALGKIPEGEELTVSYVDFLNLSADRQKKLKERFYFDCTCQHCSQHIEDDLMMAGAEGEGSKVREGTRTGHIYKSSEWKYRLAFTSQLLSFPFCLCVPLSPLLIRWKKWRPSVKSVWKRSRGPALRGISTRYTCPVRISYCLHVFHIFLSSVLSSVWPAVSQVVKLCRECLEKQENVLADTHLCRLRVLSVASEVLSYTHSFSEAAVSAHKMVEGYMWVKVFSLNRLGDSTKLLLYLHLSHGALCLSKTNFLCKRVFRQSNLTSLSSLVTPTWNTCTSKPLGRLLKNL